MAELKISELNILTFDVDSESDVELWDSFVQSMGGASSYHQMGWLRVVRDSFGHAVYPLAVESSENKILGILPLVHMKSRLFGRFLVSMPFFNYGGMLCETGEAAEALLAACERLMVDLDCEYAELRHVKSANQSLESRQHKVTMLLPIEREPDELWKSFKAKVRNQVRKAEKSGLDVVGGHQELLEPFYKVFARNMRDLGTPVYSKSFFANILEAFPDNTRIFGVTKDEQIIAAGFASWYGEVFEIPWASSLREYLPLCPNNLLYWNAISYAAQNGFKIFDFGRSTPDGGTYRFKKQWGAEPVALHWEYCLARDQKLPQLDPSNPKYELAINIWRKLPVPVATFLGPYFVRSIP